MELKRYVLLENNLIVDVSRGSLYANGHVGKYILKDNIVYSQYNDGDTLYVTYEIKKTSDNILDLVEVGDSIEIPTFKNTQLDVEEIKYQIAMVTTLTNNVTTTFNTLNGSWLKSDITAIWKRNGNTMTRYEVSK